MNTTYHRYEDAERFCCLSLGLDDSNFEAYLIRARAKNKLSKLEDAIEGQYYIISVEYIPIILRYSKFNIIIHHVCDADALCIKETKLCAIILTMLR